MLRERGGSVEVDTMREVGTAVFVCRGTALPNSAALLLRSGPLSFLSPHLGLLIPRFLLPHFSLCPIQYRAFEILTPNVSLARMETDTGMQDTGGSE
jgi:hypothetical protein